MTVSVGHDKRLVAYLGIVLIVGQLIVGGLAVLKLLLDIYLFILRAVGIALRETAEQLVIQIILFHVRFALSGASFHMYRDTVRRRMLRLYRRTYMRLCTVHVPHRSHSAVRASVRSLN